MSNEQPFLPYCGTGRMPAGTGNRLVEIRFRDGRLEMGQGHVIGWSGAKEWRYAADDER